jgi:transcriptional regulator with GAF, ATPase, and Fis domain
MFQRVVLAHDGDEVQAADLRFDSNAPASLADELAQTERHRIEEALHASGNSKADAARLLSMPRTTLINRMKRLGIDLD